MRSTATQWGRSFSPKNTMSGCTMLKNFMMMVHMPVS